MSKLPFMKWYPADFIVNTQTLSLREQGAWIRLINYIWIQSATGTVKLTDDQIKVLFQDEQANGFIRTGEGPIEEPLTHALLLLNNLITARVFEYDLEEKHGKKFHVITSKRITRDKLELKKNAKYQENHRLSVGLISKGLSKGLSKEKVRHKMLEVRSQKSEVIKDKDKKENTLAQAPKRAPFSQPTVEQIRAYATEKNIKIDAQHFWDHYESNGWRVGRNPMRDWKATVRTWSRSEFRTEGKNGANVSTGVLGLDPEKIRAARYHRHDSDLRKVSSCGEILNGVRNLLVSEANREQEQTKSD